MIKVLENVLPENEWSELNKDLNSADFSWFYQKDVIFPTHDYGELNKGLSDEVFYFAHGYISLNGNIDKEWQDKHNLPIVKFLTNYFKSDIDLFWSKANMFTRFKKNHVCGYHTDIENINEIDDSYTFIYYINTNNGGTQIKGGDFIPSVKNTGLLMKSDTVHSSVVQTDTNIRLNMNFNFKVV